MRLVSRDCERVSAPMSHVARGGVAPWRSGSDTTDDDFAETHEINVTPFIDVILVLLIIFMIAAPLATVDVPVDLPASTAQRQQRPDKPIFLTIKADLTLALGDDPVPPDSSPRRLTLASQGQPRRAHLPARRSRGHLRRRHGGDERAARGRLSQDRAGRTGGPGGEMTARALILPDPVVGAEIRRWGLAAAIVCAAHVGLMAGYLLLPEAEPEGSVASPAVIVDLAPMPVAPASQQDLAPGPEMVEAQPTPKPPPQAEPEVVEPTPKLEAPVPAEVTLPEPKPKAVEKKPEEMPPDPQKTVQRRRRSSRIRRRRRRRRRRARSRTPRRRRARRAPAAPQAARPSRAGAICVMARLQQNKRYPSGAEARREQGVVTLSFTVDRNGRC